MIMDPTFQQIFAGVMILLVVGVIGAAVGSYLKTASNATRITLLENRLQRVEEMIDKIREQIT